MVSNYIYLLAMQNFLWAKISKATLRFSQSIIIISLGQNYDTDTTQVSSKITVTFLSPPTSKFITLICEVISLPSKFIIAI